jgi:hypothetical protein
MAPISVVRSLEDLLGKVRAERDALAAEVQRLRRHYETCAHCQAVMLSAEAPRHCIDCVVTDDDLEEWEIEVARKGW